MKLPVQARLLSLPHSTLLNHIYLSDGQRPLCSPLRQTFVLILCVMLFIAVGGRARAQERAVLTQHNDNERTGGYLNETTLTPLTVNRRTGRGMQLKYTRPVDENINAQLLYMPGVVINGVQRNVVYAVTMNNTVYAYDADDETSSGTETGLLWRRHFEDPSRSIIRGIGSTPVIDPETNTLYVVYATTNRSIADGQDACGLGTNRNGAFWLAALDIRTGEFIRTPGRPNPVEVAGRASSSVAPGYVDFCAINQWQRAGLLLTRDPANRNTKYIYIAFGSRWLEGLQFYHGWVMRYDTRDFSQKGVFCTTPNRRVINEGAGIWQGAAGLAADNRDNVYFTTGNSASEPGSYGDSIVKLTPGRDRLGAYGFSAASFDAQLDDPVHAREWRENDIDLGSGGVLLIPGSTDLVGGGKTGFFYLINTSRTFIHPADRRPHLEKLQGFAAFTNIFDPAWRYGGWEGGPHLHGAPTYWGPERDVAYIYHWAENDYLKKFIYVRRTRNFDLARTLRGPISTLPPRDPSGHSGSYMPGGMISLSANGARNGILWATLPSSEMRGRLLAFDAGDLHLLWDTNLPSIAHFIPPTIADGKVFVATATGQLMAYGLREPDRFSPLSWLYEVYCLGDCGIGIRDPYTGDIVDPKVLLNPDYCPICMFAFVIDGSIREIVVDEQKMVMGLVTDGGKLRAFTAQGKEMKPELWMKTDQRNGDFNGCTGCQRVLKEGGVIRGVMLEKGQLRGLIADFPLSRKGEQPGGELRMKELPEPLPFGDPNPHVQAIMQMIDKTSVEKLMPPQGNVVLFTALGKGFQVYTCVAGYDASGGCEWVLKTSEAVLSDDVGTKPNAAFYGLGQPLGKLSDGFTWEANDGSRVRGKVQAIVEQPNTASLPWLLLKASSSEGEGSFSPVTYVQQVNTQGGRPPAKNEGKAKAGMQLRVPFTATYVFYGIKP